MQELEITTGRVANIWFAFFFRYVAGAVVAGIAAFLIAMFMEHLGWYASTHVLRYLISAILAFVWSPIALGMALRAKHNGFRIALIRSEPIPPLTP